MYFVKWTSFSDEVWLTKQQNSPCQERAERLPAHTAPKSGSLATPPASPPEPTPWPSFSLQMGTGQYSPKREIQRIRARSASGIKGQPLPPKTRRRGPGGSTAGNSRVASRSLHLPEAGQPRCLLTRWTHSWGQTASCCSVRLALGKI